MQNKKLKIGFAVIAVVIIAAGIFIFFKIKRGAQGEAQLSFLAQNRDSAIANQTILPTSVPNTAGLKTFSFDNFHGFADINPKFSFTYPASWFNDGQYLSPQPIQYYDLYSVKAPVYFDLILADIFDQTEFKYQLDTDKRLAKDATGEIDGRKFAKYDLADYGSYGGQSAGRVKIFVGPKILIGGNDYILVFRWEERPLAEPMPGNDVSVFDEMIMSLKFRL